MSPTPHINISDVSITTPDTKSYDNDFIEIINFIMSKNHMTPSVISYYERQLAEIRRLIRNEGKYEYLSKTIEYEKILRDLIHYKRDANFIIDLESDITFKKYFINLKYEYKYDLDILVITISVPNEDDMDKVEAAAKQLQDYISDNVINTMSPYPITTAEVNIDCI